MQTNNYPQETPNPPLSFVIKALWCKIPGTKQSLIKSAFPFPDKAPHVNPTKKQKESWNRIHCHLLRLNQGRGEGNKTSPGLGHWAPFQHPLVKKVKPEPFKDAFFFISLRIKQHTKKKNPKWTEWSGEKQQWWNNKSFLNGLSPWSPMIVPVLRANTEGLGQAALLSSEMT